MKKLNWRKYIKIRQCNSGSSVGTIDKNYVLANYTGAFSIPEFYLLSDEEFLSYEDWCNNLEAYRNIIWNREIVASALWDD